MIPHIIHYCWFGGREIPEKYKKCMDSWRTYCPDYEIILWNEENFDLHMNRYVEETYQNGQYAFLSDYVRLWAVYNRGGVYLDVDVELVKPLDGLCDCALYMGCEGNGSVNTGLGFGAVSGHPFLRENMALYENLSQRDEAGKLIIHACPHYTTQIFRQHGFTFPAKGVQSIDSVVLFPKEYMDPYDWAREKLFRTKNTVSIHHYMASWMTTQQKWNNMERHNHELLEKRYGSRIASVYSAFFWWSKKHGGKGIAYEVFKRLLRR